MERREKLIEALEHLEPEQAAALRSLLEDPRVRRRPGLAGWWAKYRGAVAWVALLLICAFGFYQQDVERGNRIDTVSGVFTLFCQANNQQDERLGGLVAVSLPPRRGWDALTERELEVVRTFSQERAELDDPLPCADLIALYREGGEIPTLREAERLDRQERGDERKVRQQRQRDRGERP